MNYSDFMNQLKNNNDLELVFKFDQMDIRGDYHITEVLNSQNTSIDCGTGVSRWSESVIQLHEPSVVGQDRHMKVKKALAILKKSDEVISISPEADVILEFRPKGSVAAQRYHVAGFRAENGQLFVETKGATTQCKPAVAGKSNCC